MFVYSYKHINKRNHGPYTKKIIKIRVEQH